MAKLIRLFFFCFLVATLVFVGGKLFKIKAVNVLAQVIASTVVELTNSNRQGKNLSPLFLNPLLSKAAELKARDMAKRGYFSHTDPDGRPPWGWVERAGYDYSYAGENLALNFVETDEVVSAWMQSPSHRENIMNKQYTETGIGLAEGVYEGHPALFVVQFFARPFIEKAILSTRLASSVGLIENNLLARLHIVRKLEKLIILYLSNSKTRPVVVPVDSLNASVERAVR